MFMLLVTSMCCGGLHMLAWQSDVLATGPDEVFWKLSCLLLMALGPSALSVWAGLKARRGADAHLRLNQTVNIAFGKFGIVALLAYMMSRVYLLVEIILIIPYMDPGVYRVPSFPSYWPHLG
jgi:membrane protein implicated in regulation of membrane protease activity